jgi:hypothetical protein
MKRKAFMVLGSICFLVFMIPAAAFSWSQASHAFVSDRLGAFA